MQSIKICGAFVAFSLLAFLPQSGKAENRWVTWAPESLTTAGSRADARYTYVNADGVPFRFAVDIVGGGSSGSSLEIQDADSFEVIAIHALGPELAGVSFLTDTIFAHRATVELKSPGTSPVSVRIVGLLSDDRPAGALGPSNNWQSTVKFDAHPPVRAAADSVVRLIFPGVNSVSPTCTGFVFSKPELIITNRHCIAASRQYSTSLLPGWRPCNDVTVQFGFFEADNPLPARRVTCIGAIESSTKDLALLRVEYADVGPQPVPIPAAPIPPADNDEVFVIQYPVGLPQKVSRCNWDKEDDPGKPDSDTFFRYRCSTAPGSSGAPVLNVHGQLVGVHYWSEASTAITFQAFYEALRRGGELMNRATWHNHAALLVSSTPN
jgi:V8-like Glu-specific endopeptidase